MSELAGPRPRHERDSVEHAWEKRGGYITGEEMELPRVPDGPAPGAESQTQSTEPSDPDDV